MIRILLRCLRLLRSRARSRDPPRAGLQLPIRDPGAHRLPALRPVLDPRAAGRAAHALEARLLVFDPARVGARRRARSRSSGTCSPPHGRARRRRRAWSRCRSSSPSATTRSGSCSASTRRCASSCSSACRRSRCASTPTAASATRIYRLYQDSAMVTQLIDVLVLDAARARSPRFALRARAGRAASIRGSRCCCCVAWPPAAGARGTCSRGAARAASARARETNSALTSQIQETLAGIRVIKAYGAEAREQRASKRARAAPSPPPSTRAAASRSSRSRSFWVVGDRRCSPARRRRRCAPARGAPLFAQRLLRDAGFAAWNLGLFNSSQGSLRRRHAIGARGCFATWGARAGHRGRPRPRLRAARPRARGARRAGRASPLAALRRSDRASATCASRYQRRPAGARRASTFEAPVGAITALVGPTGSGKSTLMALLLRLFDPDDGRIEIDGVDLRRFTLASLRAGVAHRAAGEPALRHDGAREHPLRGARRERRRGARSRARRLRRRVHRRRCRRATTRCSASAAPSSRPASASASRSRARC